MNIEKMIKAAQMQELPELVLKNCRIVNVFTGEIVSGDIAVSEGYIVGVGDYDGIKNVDVGGKYVLPGFVNSHVHVESSMVTPEVYAMEEMKQGTTTIITDPHEIVNVGGAEAMKEILAAAERSGINYYVMVPSCVPATPFEHSGAVMEAEDLVQFLDHPNVLGLAEMMNVPGVLSCAQPVLDKIKAFSGKVIDGHFPCGRGKSLCGYISAGVMTDHESRTYDEALEKLRNGLAVLVREGSASRNLDDIISGIVANGTDTGNVAFCSDDKHLADIRKYGTIRYNIKRSVELGMDAVKAVQIATINAARIYGLKDIGAVASGYRADMVVVNDLHDFAVEEVYKDGCPVSEMPAPEISYGSALTNNVHFVPLPEDAFDIPEKDSYSVIGVVKRQIITKNIEMTAEQLKSGLADGSVRKIAVVERHHDTGLHAAAYIKGYGLTHGAIATTVAHDSHNIIIVGDNDSDMFMAAEELKRIGGGYIIVKDGKVEGELPLKLGGLMSLESADDFISSIRTVIEKAYSLGVDPDIDPFITLSFMALPVIPEIRITDSGLFDSVKFSFI